MKNKKLSFRSWRVVALCLMCLFGVGQMWGDELCSATLTGITASSNTGGISQTGCTMKWSGLAVSGSDVVTIGTSTYHKFSGSSSYVQLVLSSGSFQAGDIITVRIAGKDSGKKTVKYSLKSDSGNSASGSASKTETDDVSYTLTADDIETDGSIKIFRNGSSNSRYGSFSVTRSSGGSGTGGGEEPSTPSSDATLKALSVKGLTLSPAFASETFAYTATYPFYASMPVVADVTATKNNAAASDPVVSISGNVISVEVTPQSGASDKKTYTITCTQQATPTASSSINIEQLVLDNSKAYNIGAALETAHIGYVDKDALDSLSSKSGRNEPYLGLKFKKTTSKVTIVVPASTALNVKFGYRDGSAGLKVSVNGSTASAPSLTSGVYTLAASEGVKEVVFTQTGAKTVVYKQIMVGEDIKPVQLPWLVTYDAGEHGTCATAKEVWWGSALTLPAVTPESGWNFDGWKDDENNDATSPYTPSKDVTLTAQYSAQASPFDLTALTYKIGAGAATNVGYVDGTFTYNIELPYAQYDAITVTPTLKVGTSSLKGDEVLTVSSLPGAATFTVVAANSSEQLYTVNFTRTPKDGVSIIKATINSSTKNSIGEVTGLYKKDASCGGLSSYKFNGKGAYIGIELVAGQTFNEGDIINIHTTSAAGQGTIALYNDHGNTVSSFHDYGVMGGTGDNKFALPASAEDKSIIYVCRTEANTWNGYVDYIEVTRAMNPLLTAIQFNSTDVEVTSTTVATLLPQGTNLGTMTVTPTIYWNGAGTAEVTSNAGAWAWGANTYRVTDKDGDYTEYTITLTEDELKHTVSFNTHGGSTIDPVQVVDGQKLAAAPAAPEKEDYIFQGWAETADGAVVDVTSFTISAAKEFHAIWASDGAIKLIEAGAINHTNFITGATMSESPVSIATVDYDYAKLGSTASNPSVNALNKLIAYNATTTQTKVMVDVYNKNTSARTVKIWGVVEGSSEYEELASIALDNGDNKRVKSAYYEFNNLDGKNRTIYIGVPSSVGDVAFLQVKVVESGDPIHMFGEVGYSINFNKGRLFGPSANDLAFEGMTYKLSSGYQALSSTAISLNKNSSYRVDVASPVTMTVTTSNGSKFYVDQATDGTANETASAGAHEFDLTAGTWYINVAGSNLSVSSISFALPKAAKPVVADLANVDYCQGSAIDALTVSATVSDGGVMLYQWYKDGDAISGAEAATYQPTVDDADGEYYVVVVNTKAGHQNSDPTQSNTITVTGHAGTAISGTTGAEDWPDAHVTISVTASGKNLSYAWYTCDDAMGTNPVAVEPAVNADELDVTVGAADTYYKVVVSGDCGSAQEAVITVVARQTVELQDVTGDMSWDFSKANDGSAAGSDLCTDEVLANVHGINNNDDFKSAYLKATAKKFKSGKLQASMIKFHTTVDGMITVVFSNTGGKDTERYLTVNGRKTDKGSKNETAVTYTGFVYAGDVVLGVVEGDGNMLNFTSVAFKATVDYPRTVNPSYLGTLCWTNNAVLGGATLYELKGKDENNYLAFDEVPENRLEAGKPYIFMPENGNTEIKLYNTDDAEPLTTNQAHVNHMYGTIVDTDLYPTTDVNMYYFSSNHIWAVKDFTVEKITIPAYYCYVDYPAVLAGEPAAAAAPGRRRVTMGVNGQNTTTGIGEIEASETPMKVMINGQIFIIRGEKMYDVTGKLVK